MNNINKLTGTVYIGGSTPNLNNAVSEIVTRVRKDGSKHLYYGSNWSGKWLYTESLDLVSQTEITKRDLNPQLYGEIVPDCKLYEILGFKKNEVDHLEEAVKDYDKLSEEQKKQYFEIELQRRFGISVIDLEENFGNSAGNSGVKRSVIPEDIYEFPSSKVKNWDSLRKHAAEILCFASPTKYEYRVRKIRVSKPVSEVRAYLTNMYKVDRAYKYACQMCHEAFSNVEMCQIANSQEVELDPMNLCLCLNCAYEYKKMRADEFNLRYFLENIGNLSEVEIESMNPVEVKFGNETIWFTQTHIAEIRELMALKQAADEYKDKGALNTKHSAKKMEEEDNPEAEVVVSGIDVYKGYIGKKIKHKAGGTGVVTKCDGKYISIQFSKGPKVGQTINYSLEMCLQNGLIELI